MRTDKSLNYIINQFKRSLLVCVCFLLFSACNDSVVSDVEKINTVNKETMVNQSVNFSLYFPNKVITDIKWTQTSGPVTVFLANTSKVIAFTPSIAGEYQFEVSFNNNGESQQLSHYLTVLDEVSVINARLDHAVLEQNNVSLRAEISADIAIDSISWEQLSEEKVTFIENGLSVNFEAPSVDKDTLLTFEVKGTANGILVSDTVTILVEDSDLIKNNAYFKDRKASTFPYDNTGPYAQDIVNCVYSNQLTSSCPLEKLPLIAHQSLTPTVEDIMSRVVVSHQWMGDRFRDFLLHNDNNNDFKNLLRATTAIVISYDVRPSFYWAATGAIYLDPKNFWLSPDERDTINESADYRASFGRELQFTMPWRYIKDNDYATDYPSETIRITRNENDGLYRLASLLYHELAHANDFFPKTEWFIHDQSSRVLDAALSTNFESDNLAIAYPLFGDEIYALAQVSFSGETATSFQKSYLPSDIKDFFKIEVANDYYNYSSPREDYAMLFEELMMQTRYQVLRDTAVTNLPSGENTSIRDYIVAWGQRGRIGETNIKDRVEFVTKRILPEFESAMIIANLPPPIAMIEGDDWLDNLSISPTVTGKDSNVKAMNADKFNSRLYPDVTGQRTYYHKELPEN
jgi:hypothetical protein|tara:strand:+ start:2512 stop:4404 length:1893 start_codon:yes stop_codon:yes gene_type:complete